MYGPSGDAVRGFDYVDTTDALSRIDATIRAEADRLLASGLRDILSMYGEVCLHGSYVLRLMTWRDLDIRIVRQEQDRTQFFFLGERIANHLSPHRMHFRNEMAGLTERLPRGLYWGIYLGDERKGAWKLDIWAVSPGDHEATAARTKHLCERLTSDERIAILKLKSELWSHPEYRRGFSSQDIYEAVLERGIRDLTAFRVFIREKGILV
jgi:hypothetical protein